MTLIANYTNEAVKNAEQIWDKLSQEGERFLVDHAKPVVKYVKTSSEYNNNDENWSALKFEDFKVHYAKDNTTSVVIELYNIDRFFEVGEREDDEVLLFNDDIEDVEGWSWYSHKDLEKLLLA